MVSVARAGICSLTDKDIRSPRSIVGIRSQEHEDDELDAEKDAIHIQQLGRHFWSASVAFLKTSDTYEMSVCHPIAAFRLGISRTEVLVEQLPHRYRDLLDSQVSQVILLDVSSDPPAP